MERQRRAQLEEELKEARRRLEADMDIAYQDYQTQLLREGKVLLFSVLISSLHCFFFLFASSSRILLFKSTDHMVSNADKRVLIRSLPFLSKELAFD